MAHYAKIKNGVVAEVIVISDADCLDENDVESETVGQTYIASLGLTGDWVQTSYSGNMRGRYAGIGDTYDADADVFVAPTVATQVD